MTVASAPVRSWQYATAARGLAESASSKSVRAPPSEKCSPAPVSTRARTPSSRATAVVCRTRPSSTSPSSVLPCSGRLMVSTATDPNVSRPTAGWSGMEHQDLIGDAGRLAFPGDLHGGPGDYRHPGGQLGVSQQPGRPAHPGAGGDRRAEADAIQPAVDHE